MLFNNSKKQIFNRLGKSFATWYDKELPYEIILHNKKYGNIYMKPLNPDSPEDFEEFKDIISQPNVALTSSWMDSLFGLENLENLIKNSKNPNEDIRKLIETENDKVKKTYDSLTTYNKERKLGYCGIYDDNNKLLGGCGITPVRIDNGQLEACDVSLHILPEYQRGGLGTDLMQKMLDYSLTDRHVPKIVGTSLKKHLGTPPVCAQYGFIMKDVGKYKHYLLTNTMWNTNKIEMNEVGKETAVSDIIKQSPQESRMNFDKLQGSNPSSINANLIAKTDNQRKMNTKERDGEIDKTIMNTKF